LINKIKYAYREIKGQGDDPYWWKYRIIDRVIGRILFKNNTPETMGQSIKELVGHINLNEVI